MRRFVVAGGVAGTLCAKPSLAMACATCNVDGGVGQGVMLTLMLLVPLLVLGVGYRVVRSLLKRMESA